MDIGSGFLIEHLAAKVLSDFSKSNNDLERKCWSIVHEYQHGFKPTEYDIREVEEELYLAVLRKVKADN